MKIYAYFLYFMHAVAPEQVEILNGLSKDVSIGVVEESQNNSHEISVIIMEEQNKDAPDYGFNEEEDHKVQIILDQEQVIIQSIKSLKDSWNNMLMKVEARKK